MTPAEYQQISDLIDLHVHQYFDHYLTEVFPTQMERCFDTHNVADTSHPKVFAIVRKTQNRMDRALWMGAGISALVAGLTALGSLLYYWNAVRGH